MNSKFEVFNTFIVVGTAVLLVVACASAPERMQAQKNKIQFALVVPNAGFNLLSLNKVSPTLAITDYDGVTIKRSWNFEEDHKGKFTELHDCLHARTESREQSQGAVTDKPFELLRDAATVCTEQVGLPPANETNLGNMNGFTVLLSVIADSVAVGSGAPLFRTGGGNLGAKFQINRPDISYKQAYSDVNHCLDGAAEQGVINASSSQLSGQSDFVTTHSSQSIEPFLNRFTSCLKSSGYTVTG